MKKNVVIKCICALLMINFSVNAQTQEMVFQTCREGGLKLKFQPVSPDSQLSNYVFSFVNLNPRLLVTINNNAIVSNNNLLLAAQKYDFKATIQRNGYGNFTNIFVGNTCDHDGQNTNCPENTNTITISSGYKNSWHVGDVFTATWNGTLQGTQHLDWYNTNMVVNGTQTIYTSGNSITFMITGIPATLHAQPSADMNVLSGCHGWTELYFTNDCSTPIPVPTASLVAPYCQNATAAALTATPIGTNKLYWYNSSSTGGVASTSATIPSTVATGIVNYFVSQKDSNNCESPRAAIAVTVNPTPSAPITSALFYCQNATATILTATATGSDSLLWYGLNSTGGIASTAAPIPTTTTAGVVTYYVSQKAPNNCESPRAGISVTVNVYPSPPTNISGNITIFTGGSTSLTANGCSGTIKWYDASTVGNLISTGNPLNVSPTATTNYYASCTANTCESQTRTTAKVTYNLCVDNPTLQDYGTGTTTQVKAPNTMTEANKVNIGANVLYQAGKVVKLMPGFKADKGSIFSAKIGGCNN